MVLTDILLIASIVATITCAHYYSKTKSILREFMQQSRRHHYHRELDAAIEKKAKKYLAFTIICLLISAPLLAQKIILLYKN